MSFYHQNIIKNRLFSQKSRQKDVLHFFLFCFKKIIFLHFDLWNDLSTLKMTLNQQNNTKWIFQTKSHEKEVLHMFLAWFVKNDNFAYLTLKIDFLTLKMTLSHENNTRNGLPGQNHTKMRYYTCSWLHLLNNHSWPWDIWRPFCFWPWQCPFGLEDDLGSPK